MNMQYRIQREFERSKRGKMHQPFLDQRVAARPLFPGMFFNFVPIPSH